MDRVYCCGLRVLQRMLSSCGAWAKRSVHVKSSWTSSLTHVCCTGRRTLNHWTAREVLYNVLSVSLTQIFLGVFTLNITLYIHYLTQSSGFNTVHGVLKGRILKWFAIPFSSGSHSVRPLHHDPPILGCPAGMAWFH